MIVYWAGDLYEAVIRDETSYTLISCKYSYHYDYDNDVVFGRIWLNNDL